MNLYVGNLPYKITEDELRQVFLEFGPVNTVNIIKDRETGNSKGFAFVEMSNATAAEKAIQQLNGNSVGGRNIRVNEARPKNERAKVQGAAW